MTERIKRINVSSERCVIVILFLGLFFIPLTWAFTTFLDKFHIDFPLWVRVIGIIISVSSLPYFWWIHKTLGQNWSPSLEIRKEHELIKSGPYKWIRHPMYLQIFIWTIAQALIASNLMASPSGLMAWTFLYCIRIPKEEKMMIENFGDEYKLYINQTGKIFPKLRNK